MPTQYQFGQELDQNMRCRQNLSNKQRDWIVERLAAGATLQECAGAYSRIRHCIHDLWKKYQIGTTKDKPCIGRLPILLLYQKKITYWKACVQSKIEYKVLAKAGVLVNSDNVYYKQAPHPTKFVHLFKHTTQLPEKMSLYT
jgi:hypothetical protein